MRRLKEAVFAVLLIFVIQLQGLFIFLGAFETLGLLRLLTISAVCTEILLFWAFCFKAEVLE